MNCVLPLLPLVLFKELFFIEHIEEFVMLAKLEEKALNGLARL